MRQRWSTFLFICWPNINLRRREKERWRKRDAATRDRMRDAQQRSITVLVRANWKILRNWCKAPCACAARREVRARGRKARVGRRRNVTVYLQLSLSPARASVVYAGVSGTYINDTARCYICTPVSARFTIKLP